MSSLSSKKIDVQSLTLEESNLRFYLTIHVVNPLQLITNIIRLNYFQQ